MAPRPSGHLISKYPDFVHILDLHKLPQIRVVFKIVMLHGADKFNVLRQIRIPLNNFNFPSLN